MNPLDFFISNFIVKNRKKRWQFLANGKWSKFAGKMNEIDNHLNSNCTRYENNSFDKCKEIIDVNHIEYGYYYDSYSIGVKMSTTNLDDIFDDSLFICPQAKIAFFFHHDGWIWFCDAK